MPKNMNDSQSRRSIVQLALRTTAVASLAEMLPPLALADNVPLERAAVCIYLIGGNDSNNMIVPLDSTSFSTYASARRDLGLPQAAFLPVNSSTQAGSFGF